MSTKSALQSLEKAFQLIKKVEKRDDEFTIDDYIKHNKTKGIAISRYTARYKLNVLVESKMLIKRKILLNGIWQMVFSPA